jgi:hypothetical protein
MEIMYVHVSLGKIAVLTTGNAVALGIPNRIVETINAAVIQMVEKMGTVSAPVGDSIVEMIRGGAAAIVAVPVNQLMKTFPIKGKLKAPIFSCLFDPVEQDVLGHRNRISPVSKSLSCSSRRFIGP